MSAVDEAPEREASAKVAQHLAGAVQMAEAICRMRQQAADRQAAGDQVAAAAARAERSAQHAADRLRWTPATAKQWVQDASLRDLGRAWAAAAGWADTDPAADVAATRVETRLADLAPNAMARFDDLRQDGWTRVDAMRDVLPWLAMEDHLRSQDRRVFVAEPGQTTTADAQARADGIRGVARMDLARPDDPATPRVDEHVEGVGLGRLERAEAAVSQADANTATSRKIQLDEQGRRVTADGRAHAADLAAEAYPRPYTQIQPNTTTLACCPSFILQTTASLEMLVWNGRLVGTVTGSSAR